MKGNKIILSSNPRGAWFKGPVTGTPQPGTTMQIDVSEGINDDGQFTFEAFSRDADGDRPAGPLLILLEPDLRGVAVNTSTSLFAAYVAGDQVQVYCPLPGEEFNLIHENVAGTGDDVAVGDLMIVDSGTGKLKVTTGSPEIEPFQALEARTDPTADLLIHVIHTGY